MTRETAVRESLARLDALQARGMRLALDPMRELLAKLGDPHAAYEWIHVGGTNGKGSVAAMCEAMLLAAGHDAGLYTSPHLVRPGERIRVRGRELSDAELAADVDRVWPAVESVAARHDGVTYFEAMTAIAFDRFAREGVEVAVVEVGLGGRLDATNVHPSPLATLVTNVGRDHADVLGDDPATVAHEKAAILRPGVPAFTAARGPALDAIDAHARAVGAPLAVVGRDLAVERLPPGAGERFRLDGEELSTNLAGAHQAANAALAVAAVRAAGARGVVVGPEAVRRGLANVQWRGRLETLPGAPALLLDGAHNPDGVETLVAHLRERGLRPTLLFGVLEDKAWPEMLAMLAGEVGAVVATRPPTPRALPPREAAREFSRAGVVATVVEDVDHALATAEGQAGAAGTVLVTGSLYLVGEVLRLRGAR